MAIKIFKENLIEKFKKEAVALYDYTSSKNMIGNPNYNSKYSVKLGKSLDKIVKEIINSSSDMDEFIKLLDSKEFLIAYLASEYLYPVKPTKCLSIMRKFYEENNDEIDRFTIKTKIEGISAHQVFFMETYKKLYNCENLDSLNRENNIKAI